MNGRGRGESRREAAEPGREAEGSPRELTEDVRKEGSGVPVLEMASSSTPTVGSGERGGEVAEGESLESIVEAAARAEREKMGNVPPRMTSIAMVVPAKMLFGVS